MQVTILDEAEKDLEDGYHFYETQLYGLGTYFLDSIYSDIDCLSCFGGIHSTIFGHYRLLSKRFPFAIYYKTANDIVLVTAVLDCRRDPNWTRKRLEEE